MAAVVQVIKVRLMLHVSLLTHKLLFIWIQFQPHHPATTDMHHSTNC